MPGLTIHLDECVDHHVIPHLEARNHIVFMAQGEGMTQDDDEGQIRYAHARGWVILTTNRGVFQREHKRFRARGETHSGIMTVPQDDQHPARFFLRCAMLSEWVLTKQTRESLLFRWTDLQQALQQAPEITGFTTDEIAYALGRDSHAP